jgi:FkbH-like protein
MNNRDQIYRALSDASGSADTLVIYSSLIHLSAWPQKKYDYLAALNQLLLDGKTILLPSFTFTFCAGKKFHIDLSRSETGILADWFMGLDVSSRTKHPIYSFVVAGKYAHEVHALNNKTSFSDDSIFAWIEGKNARNIMLGCDWIYCTQFHRYEEEANVPYRFFKTFESTADYGDGEAPIQTTMFVRDLDALPDHENDFSSAIELLKKRDDFMSLSLLDGKVESISCRSFAEICREQLELDVYTFIEEPRKVEYLLKQKKHKRSIKISLLGSSNLEFLSKALMKAFKRYFDAYSIEIFTVPFGQLYDNIYNDSSLLYSFEPDVALVVDRLEDVFQVNRLEDFTNNGDRAHILLNEYINALEKFSTKSNSLTVVTNFMQSDISLSSLSELIGGCNHILKDFIDKNERLSLFDLSNSALREDVSVIFDPRIWYMGRFPYSLQFTSSLAEGICGVVLSHLGLSARLVIVDLDNTLWGGVLGEDGIGGIQIGGDYPGNAYVDFQKCLKKLSERGVALAICSKNHEDDALSVFNKREEMVLEKKDFVSYRINWDFKTENISGIANELGLGLSNILFVDDNPVERELVKKYLPEVRVLELPGDPALYLQALQGSPYLVTNGVTDEDRKRVKNYQSRTEIHRQRINYSDAHSFYASLEMHLHFNALSEKNLARATQLVNKTNQFNATGLRFSSAQLQSMAENGGSVYVIGLQDKYSEFENIGVLIVDWMKESEGSAAITNFLLSCRVLGRGVETGVLSWLHTVAKRKSIDTLMASICSQERNKPVHNLYCEHGYEKGSKKGEWFLSLSKIKPTIPEWIVVESHCE